MKIAGNPNFRMVSHQGFSVTEQWLGNSRLSSYIGSAKEGFLWAETDIKFSKDGIPVCCHDMEYTDTHDGKTRIRIPDHTLAELKTYGYYGEVIATFEEVLSTCKTEGLGLYIDHLDASWSDEMWQSVFDIVLKYKMEGNVEWLCSNAACVERVLAWDEAAAISLVTAEPDLTRVIDIAKKYKTPANRFTVNALYTRFTVEDIIAYNARIPVGVRFELWIIDGVEDLKKYMPYINGITTNTISPKNV